MTENVAENPNAEQQAMSLRQAYAINLSVRKALFEAYVALEHIPLIGLTPEQVEAVHSVYENVARLARDRRFTHATVHLFCLTEDAKAPEEVSA